MSDMTAVIVPKSDQINSDDLIAGPMTITVTDVNVVGGTEQPVSISFAGSPKFFRPCKSMSRVLVAAWGPDSKAYIGRSMTLYRDPKVKWGGMEVGGIRISHMTHIERDMTMMLTMTKQNRAPHRVQPLKLEAPKHAAPSQNDAAIIAEARAAAWDGTDAFRVWFKANPEKRAAVKSIMETLKQTCADADAMKSDAPEVDKFGLPPLNDNPTLTPDEIEAKIRADLEARNRAMDGE